MRKEFVCMNCGKNKSIRGNIPSWLRPALLILFANPTSDDVCNECADKFTMIGFVITIILMLFVLVLFFRYM